MLRGLYTLHLRKPCNASLFSIVRDCAHPQESSTLAPVSSLERQHRKYDVDEVQAYRRQRKTEWKRRQKGQTFLDHLILNVRGGKGGDGAISFHREKYARLGPPSGGNGGRGADVYILPTPHMTTLSYIPKNIRGDAGGNGGASWQNGKSAPPIVIKVPLGTVVRELPAGDTRRAKDEWEAFEDSLEGLDPQEKVERRQQRRWVHIERYEEANRERESFQQADDALNQQERQRCRERRQRQQELINLDLDKSEELVIPDDAPLALGHKAPLGHLVASGGQGGLGNPTFLSPINRSPKFATRGHDGERVTLSLELKLLADVGLVGMPNAGKSTLLRALTGGRAKTEVAGYAFTTLNPVVATVRVAHDGTFEGAANGVQVFGDTADEEAHERARMADGGFAFARTRNQRGQTFSDVDEAFRFTIADNPGLLEHAAENVGLGHSFLRSLERAHALAYVVDLSEEAPWDALRVLRAELEAYQTGLSAKARLVVANKADLVGAPGEVDAARQKLHRLEEYVRDKTGSDVQVVPVSARHSQNLRRVVATMRAHVEAARAHSAT